MSDDIATAPEAAPAATTSLLGARGTREFIRYFVASGLALAVDVLSLYVLTSMLAVPYLISGALAFTLGLVVVYILSIRWVFESRMETHWAVEFALFALIGLMGLLINEAFLWVFTSVFGFYYLVSKIASVIAVFTWNFCARKYFLFR